MKFALWVLVALAIVIWLSRGKKIASGKKAAEAARPPAAADGIEPIVRCAHCGVHIPASESVVTASGTVFCSEEHRLRHAAR